MMLNLTTVSCFLIFLASLVAICVTAVAASAAETDPGVASDPVRPAHQRKRTREYAPADIADNAVDDTHASAVTDGMTRRRKRRKHPVGPA